MTLPQPLAGLRVVELATGIAGPYAGKLLADYGAEVVKVEPPTGDESRREGTRFGPRPAPEASPLFLHLNTNKRSVVADLGSVSDRELVRALAAESINTSDSAANAR
ncbi:MAG: CoA transferase, partial [Actinomycetota bacterium]